MGEPPADLVRIVRPIVRGQLRSFIADHPGELSPRWIASIEKRIVNDLLSRGPMLRLRAALCGARAASLGNGDLGPATPETPAAGVAVIGLRQPLSPEAEADG